MIFLEVIQTATHLLRKGGLVAFPTETVYGLGADAFNAKAVAKIFEVKKRPSFDPIIVHVASIDQACRLWKHVPKPAQLLMKTFWPGPLTLVLPKKKIIPDIVTAGLDTVAVRMPNHPVALELIRCLGHPIAAPSANLFGRTSPTTAQAVRENLGKKVDLILDGGPCAVGLESTVVKIKGDKIILLRPGGISVEEIKKFVSIVADRRERLFHRPTVFAGDARRGITHKSKADALDLWGSRAAGPAKTVGQHTSVESPGQIKTHYAPKTSFCLVDSSYSKFLGQLGFKFKKCREKNLPWPRIGLLSFDKKPRSKYFKAAKTLSQKRDLREAAANLFEAMRKLDKMGLDLIVAERVPKKGLGLAIMDRLEKASGMKAGMMGFFKK